MNIIKSASAGTLESSDAYVEIEPYDKGLEIQIQSVVENQFGEAIRTAILDVLRKTGTENALVRISDRGALDCVIRARVETAVMRGRGECK